MMKRIIALVFVLALVAATYSDHGGDDTTPSDTKDITETTAPGETPTETSAPEGTQAPTPPLGDAAQGSGILAAVKARGVLKCGVSGMDTAFSEQHPDGSVTGFDADYCRYIAAAVTGSAHNVAFTLLTAAEQFTAVKTGAVDVLIGNTTYTQSRDTDFDYAPTTYYDGQQVMAREADGFDPTSQIGALEGAVVCTTAETTSEQYITEVTAAMGVNISLQTFKDFNEVMDNYMASFCDAVTTYGSGLIARKATQEPDGENWMIFPASPISKEPLSPVTPQNDSQWLDVVTWAVYSSIIFDEKGVTSSNAVDAIGTIDGEVDRLLGGKGELQTAMGLSADAWRNAVTQVGNYDEIYSRNLNPVGLVRELGSLNASFLNGGLIYAPPAR